MWNPTYRSGRRSAATLAAALAVTASTALLASGSSGPATASVHQQRPYDPLNPLTPQEITKAVAIVKASGKYVAGMTFPEIRLKEPDKKAVWAWELAGAAYRRNPRNALPRLAGMVVSRQRQTWEAVVNLGAGRVESFTENKSGGYAVFDTEPDGEVVARHPAVVAALKKRRDIAPSRYKDIIWIGLTVGYYGDKDVDPKRRLLKYTGFLPTDDGNWFTHPIENLVITVDVDTEEILKVEDHGVVPVPQGDHGYAKGDRDSTLAPPQPIVIRQPKGVSYTLDGQQVSWQGWKFHFRIDPRTGPVISAASIDDGGERRKVLYSGGLSGMTVPYGDPAVGWYWKTYMDAGEYGVGRLGRRLVKGSDVPDNTTLVDATFADMLGEPYTKRSVIGIFERYADAEWTHENDDVDPIVDTAPRRELVVRFIATIGNYDYIFDYVLAANGSIRIDVGASGVEAIKGGHSTTVDSTDKHYIDPHNHELHHGTLLHDHTIGVFHQHIYNFRLDLDVDGDTNTVLELDPYAAPLAGHPARTSEFVLKQRTYKTEQEAIQRIDLDKTILVTNPTRTNRNGYLTGYQVIPFAGGTHPFAEKPIFLDSDYLMHRAGYMKNHLYVTPFQDAERYAEGTFVNQNPKETGLPAWVAQNRNIYRTDDVVWITTGTTHVPRAEEFPIMPTEWSSTMVKPFNFFDRTPTLNLREDK